MEYFWGMGYITVCLLYTSVAVSLIQHVVGITNMSSISLQDLNKRFYATGMYGKLLNACADIPCKAMENTDVLKLSLIHIWYAVADVSRI